MTRATPIHLSEDERTHVQVFVRRGKVTDSCASPAQMK